MAKKITPLTEEKFQLLNTTIEWNIDEVPQNYWDKIPGLQRLESTFAILASGTTTSAQVLNGVNAIAGIDVLVHEENPMIAKKEPEGNAYHYVIQKINDERFPYLMYGPFKSETIVPHWFDSKDLDKYWGD